MNSRMAGQYGVEFDTISSYEFKERLASQGQRLEDLVTTALTASRRVDTTLNDIYSAPRP